MANNRPGASGNKEESEFYKEMERRYESFKGVNEAQLNLTEIAITDESQWREIILFLKEHPQIKKLDVSYCQVGDPFIMYFADHNATIEHLTVNLGSIGPEGARYFAIHNACVTYLDLERNALGDEGIEYFAEYNKRKSRAEKVVEFLCLKENDITAKGWKAFSQKNTSVLKLVMRDDRLSNEALCSLVEYNRSITDLDISHNQLNSDNIMDFVCLNKHIRRLNLSGNQISSVALLYFISNNNSVVSLDVINSGVDTYELSPNFLKHNKCLKSLDLRENEIHDKFLELLVKNNKMISYLAFSLDFHSRPNRISKNGFEHFFRANKCITSLRLTVDRRVDFRDLRYMFGPGSHDEAAEAKIAKEGILENSKRAIAAFIKENKVITDLALSGIMVSDEQLTELLRSNVLTHIEIAGAPEKTQELIKQFNIQKLALAAVTVQQSLRSPSSTLFKMPQVLIEEVRQYYFSQEMTPHEQKILLGKVDDTGLLFKFNKLLNEAHFTEFNDTLTGVIIHYDKGSHVHALKNLLHKKGFLSKKEKENVDGVKREDGVDYFVCISNEEFDALSKKGAYEAFRLNHLEALKNSLLTLKNDILNKPSWKTFSIFTGMSDKKMPAELAGKLVKLIKDQSENNNATDLDWIKLNKQVETLLAKAVKAKPRKRSDDTHEFYQAEFNKFYRK